MHRSYSTWQVFAEYPPVQACRWSLHCLQLLACCACAKSDAFQPIKTIVISNVNRGIRADSGQARRSLVMSGRSVSSKRNLPEKASVAQSLDGNRLTGSLLIPGARLYSPAYSITSESRANVRFVPIADIRATWGAPQGGSDFRS